MPLRIAEEELCRLPAKGWATMIWKVRKADPQPCLCCCEMRVVAFLTEPAVFDRIIDFLKPTFAAEQPPPPRVLTEAALRAVEESGG